VVFVGRAPDEEFKAADFDELTRVQCGRHGLSVNTVIIEISSSQTARI
jgi:hypothetical protein